MGANATVRGKVLASTWHVGGCQKEQPLLLLMTGCIETKEENMLWVGSGLKLRNPESSKASCVIGAFHPSFALD